MDLSPMSHWTAADVMSASPVTVAPRETVKDALALMADHHVSGVPVVTRQGRCVGVITASDILNYEQEHGVESSAAPHEGIAGYFNNETQRWEAMQSSALAFEELEDVAVEEIMSHDIMWVAPATPLADVARKMVAEDVHRVLVLDNKRNLMGIVSASDFVRAFAGAM
jgi:CBS domain-containing protein